jgi:hypothetical protein
MFKSVIMLCENLSGMPDIDQGCQARNPIWPGRWRPCHKRGRVSVQRLSPINVNRLVGRVSVQINQERLQIHSSCPCPASFRSAMEHGNQAVAPLSESAC